MNKRKSLGKGLNALFPDITSIMEEQRPGDAILVLPIEEIHPNPYQPRKVFDPRGIEELAASLRSSGLIQPLVVRKGAKGYELIAGERRWRAAAKAQLREVPVVVKDVADDQMLKLSLIENLQRESLNPIEEAEAYLRLTEEFSLSQEEVAMVVGKDRSTVANAIRLLKLPEKIKEDIAGGKISPGHARALLALDTNGIRLRLYQLILKKELTVREAEALAKKLVNEKPTAARRRNDDPQLRFIREDLQHRFATQIRIVRKRGKGKIEIMFFSDEDLDRILEIMQGRN